MFRMKRAFTKSAVFLFLELICFYLIYPPVGAHPFHDEVGNWLVFGIWGSFGLALIIPMIVINANKHIPERFNIITSCTFAGLGLILLGYWVYGEKERFAALPVYQVMAKVTKLNGGIFYSVEYEYVDQSGVQHKGRDNVNAGSTWQHLKADGTTPVNYLQADPEVSRIIEYGNGQATFIRGFLIMLGIGTICSPILLFRFHNETDQRINESIDAWLMKKAREKDEMQDK